MHTLISKALSAGFAASVAVTGGAAPRTGVAGLQAAHTSTLAAALYAIPSVEQKSPLDLWIEKLAYLESEGKEHLKVLDHNGYYSYGCLQFQMGTFAGYGKKYGLLTDGSDIDTAIYDCGLQKAVAKRMIEDDFDNWRHWFTSVKVRKLGFPPKDEEPVTLSSNS